ncbi:AMP-binding protein [Micromonospora cathayae]|uniref:AMP-binding protein n=1 Tax=Micromonospora cathayae TaxID=3028804 RepID=A0ABY7ZJ46_9ACTN|nr:AMP-binding protein [Micromonospora sp. HUAS 3]WDZ82302.1 AMP-binding protein [Micromonospora sp. HUAS 3]
MQLWDNLTGAGARGRLHAWAGNRFTATPWSEVVADGRAAAAALRRAGVRPGRQVAAVLDNSPEAVRGLLGVWLAGGAVASLPVPTRGMDRQEYARHLTALVGNLDAPVLLADEKLVPLLPEELSARLSVRSWQSLAGGNGRIDEAPPGPDELAFVQYSSGSTSVPKGCALTTRAIGAQLELILAMAGGVPGEETVASWLPLSHDMGMFGCLLYAWAHDFGLVLSTPERFMMSPRTWFRDMAEYGATMTAGTSTALHLAARGQGSGALAAPLRLRVCVVGAERVEWEALRRTVAAFGPYGLRSEALMPAYGLAEATLAVTACPHDEAPRFLDVDGNRLADGEVVACAADDPAATRVVSTGRPCAGVSVELAEPGRLSEIRIASPSLASGYFADPERTAARFVDGRLRTGDLGFQHDGELYVVGRSDDLLSVGGRNVYAREIESTIDGLDAVRKGCAVIVDVAEDGRSELVLLVELKARSTDYRAFADEAAAIAMTKAGVSLAECVFLPKGTLPKTPSGKIQRFRCRSLLASDALVPLARVTVG